MTIIGIALGEDVVSMLVEQGCDLRRFSAVEKVSRGDVQCHDDDTKAVIVDTRDIQDAPKIPAVIRKLGFEGPIVGISGRPRDSQKDDDEEFQITFVRNGGDRLLGTPFTGRLIVWVIDALLRRTGYSGAATTPKPKEKQTCTFGGDRYLMDQEKHTLFVKGKPVRLTCGEFQILWKMGSHPGGVFSRGDLEKEVGEEGSPDSHWTVYTHIKRLRLKIRPHDEEYQVIKSLYGLGYQVKK